MNSSSVAPQSSSSRNAPFSSDCSFRKKRSIDARRVPFRVAFRAFAVTVSRVVAVDERWPATLATEPVRCAAFGRSRRALPQRTSLERRPRSSPCSGPTRRGGAAAGAGSGSATSVGRGSLVYEARLYWRSLR